MEYCENKNSATIIYKFKDTEEKRFIVKEQNLPVKVSSEKIKKSSGVKSSFEASFEGDAPGSYAFTINAPSEIPENSEVEIYLESGTWDDYGGVGTYTTEIGIVESYKGEPLLIGTGFSVQGTVTNVEPVQCYARISIDWRYEDACKLVISYLDKILYEEIGECPLNFEVVCDKDCPPEHLKCKSNKYPGYCCLPCSRTANKIRVLGSRLQ